MYSFDWETVTSVNYNTDYPRTYDVQCDYASHKKITGEMFGGFEDYMQVAYIDRFEPFILIPNRYPYRADHTIRHYLLWVNPRYIQYITLEVAEHIVRARFPNCEIYCRMNSMEVRSVLSVPHYQVFVSAD